MIETSKLKDMIAGIKPTVLESSNYIVLDNKQISSELEDVTYFIEQAKKYRNNKSVMRAALACQALGVYLESLVNKEE